MAGALLDTYGFQWTVTVPGLACLFIGTILLVVLMMFGNEPVKICRFSFNARPGDDNIRFSDNRLPGINNTEKSALLASNNKENSYTSSQTN